MNRPMLRWSRTAKSALWAAGAAAFSFVVPFLAPAIANEEGPPATWTRVQAILDANCVRCHTAGSVAPMSLRTYAEVRPWAKSIRRNVESGAMPPWFADPAIGRFSNDSRLAQEDIDTLIAWVDAGAPAGEGVANQVEVRSSDPVSSEPTWQLGTPDLVVEMPQPFAIPESGTLDYVYMRTPMGNETAKWVGAVEVLAGSRRHVHHIDVQVCSSGCPESDFYANLEAGVPTQPTRRRRTPSKPQFDEVGMIDGDTTEFYYSFLPGGAPLELPAGHGRLLPPNAELLLSLHYTTDGEAAQDKSRVGLYFLDEPPEKRVVSFFLDNPTIWVPAGAARYEARTRATLAREVQLLAVTPHMHFRGSAAELSVRLPQQGAASQPTPVLSVPNYDFAWQITYQLASPLTLPAGSELRLLNVFDNSSGNPNNPDPTVDVPWGLQSWDEMSSAFLEFSVPLEVGGDAVFAMPEDD